MKKYLYLTIIVITFSLYHNALAISGACSSHFGVNCDAGISSYGNVICNDGWVDSSVAYVDTNECIDNVQCTQDEYNSLLKKNGVTDAKLRMKSDTQQVQDIENQIQNIRQNKLNEIAQSGGIANESSVYSEVLRDSQQLTEKVRSLNEDASFESDNINLLTSKANGECHSLGLAKIFKQNQDIINSKQQLKQILPEIKIDKSIGAKNVNATDQCISTWGEHTHPSSDTSNIFTKLSGCACDSGYTWTNLTDTKNYKCISVVKNIQNENIKTLAIPISSATIIISPTTPASIPTTIIQTKYKHWYDWFNPLIWFKK